jgi:hypothetical protein
MVTLNYTELLDSAKTELESLHQLRNELDLQRAETDAKILALSKTITAIAPITGPEEEQKWLSFLNALGATSAEVGITERIRGIFKGATTALATTDVRDQLQNSGWDLTKYSNALSTVHTVVKRLLDNGELGESTQDGARVYRWKK